MKKLDKAKPKFNLSPDLELAETLSFTFVGVIALTESNSKIINTKLPKDAPKIRQPNMSKAILNWSPNYDRTTGMKLTYDYFK